MKPLISHRYSTKDALIQCARLLSPIVTILVIGILMFLPQVDTHFYMAKLDCTHVDVSNGLFSALKSSLNDPVSIKSDTSSLSTSEILILSEYISEQVATAAQFLDTSMFGWCYGTYQSLEQFDSATNTFELVSFEQVVVTCSGYDKDYVFDYRGQLSKTGLDIILAYAYGSDDTTTTTANYVADAGYTEELKSRQSKFRAASSMYYGCGLIEVLVLLIGYGHIIAKRKCKLDDHKTSVIFNVVAVSALFASGLAFASTILLMFMMRDIRRNVKTELGNFGISLHCQPAWFVAAWIIVAISVVSAFSWGGPIWCATETPVDDAEEMHPLQLASRRSGSTDTWNDSNNTINYPAEDTKEVSLNSTIESDALDSDSTTSDRSGKRLLTHNSLHIHQV